MTYCDKQGNEGQPAPAFVSSPTTKYLQIDNLKLEISIHFRRWEL